MANPAPRDQQALKPTEVTSQPARNMPHLVDTKAFSVNKAAYAFLLCRDDFSIVYVSDLLQAMLQLPEQRAGGQRRDVFALLGSSSVLDNASVEANLGPLRLDGLRSVSYELRTEAGLHPIHLRIKPAGDGQWMLSFEDVQADQTQRAELLALTLTDPLVGTNNRRCFQQTVKASLADNIPGTVLLLDLDRFKTVNDTLGHPIGDQLLRKVAERLRTVVGDDNLLARLGGDEFAVWCCTINTEAMEKLAARIVEMLGRPFLIEGNQINIGSSVGLAFATEAGTTYERLMKCADLALYAVKEGGRNGCRCFDPTLEVAAHNRRKLEIQLRKALTLRQFEVHYSSRVNVETGKTVGLQAVLRWRHPELGLLEPTRFMDLAGEIGLVPAIGKWLLKTACAQVKTFPGEPAVSVSIAEAQIDGRDSLLEAVKGALQSSGLLPDRLELEITEDILLHQEDRVLKTLHELRNLGVRVGVENFGTGYASLSKLVSFPFDRIKIAPSIAHGTLNGTHRAIVNAVAMLGCSLGVSTLIDGIDTQEQLDRVRRGGGSTVQGCRLEPALPAADTSAAFAHATENTLKL